MVRVLCEVNQLSVGEACTNAPAYSITISYLGRPALTLNLCRVHVLDTWHLAQTDSEAVYGHAGHVKSVAVKKLEE